MNIATDNRKLSWTYDKSKDTYSAMRGSTPVAHRKTQKEIEKWIKEEEAGIHKSAMIYYFRRLKPTTNPLPKERLVAHEVQRHGRR